MPIDNSTTTAETTEQADVEESAAPKTPADAECETLSTDTVSADDGPPEPAASPWLRRGDQLFVGTLVIAAVLLMAAHWARQSGWGMQPVEIERLPARQFDFQLEINSATWVEWMQLEGIGDTLARRIVEDRETNGPFADIDELTRVKGIGPKTVEKIRPWLRVESVDSP